jgi:hypothetical protein
MPLVAAFLCSGQLEILAQAVKQRNARLNRKSANCAIDEQGNLDHG